MITIATLLFCLWCFSKAVWHQWPWDSEHRLCNHKVNELFHPYLTSPLSWLWWASRIAIIPIILNPRQKATTTSFKDFDLSWPEGSNPWLPTHEADALTTMPLRWYSIPRSSCWSQDNYLAKRISASERRRRRYKQECILRPLTFLLHRFWN